MSDFEEDNIAEDKVIEAEVVEVADKNQDQNKKEKVQEKKNTDRTENFKKFVNGFGMVTFFACLSIVFALLQYIISGLVSAAGGYPLWIMWSFGMPQMVLLAVALGFYVYQSIYHKLGFKFDLSVFMLIIATAFAVF